MQSCKKGDRKNGVATHAWDEDQLGLGQGRDGGTTILVKKNTGSADDTKYWKYQQFGL